MALGIAGEKASGSGEGAVMADAGEDVEDFALRRLRVANAVGREQRQFQLARDFDGGLVAGFLFAAEVALQFDIDIVTAEYFAELLDGCGRGFDSALSEGVCERAFIASGEADEAGGAFGNFFG